MAVVDSGLIGASLSCRELTFRFVSCLHRIRNLKLNLSQAWKTAPKIVLQFLEISLEVRTSRHTNVQLAQEQAQVRLIFLNDGSRLSVSFKSSEIIVVKLFYPIACSSMKIKVGKKINSSSCIWPQRSIGYGISRKYWLLRYYIRVRRLYERLIIKIWSDSYVIMIWLLLVLVEGHNHSIQSVLGLLPRSEERNCCYWD